MTYEETLAACNAALGNDVTQRQGLNPIGASFYNNMYVPLGVHQIIDPSTNVNGVIIRRAGMDSWVNSSHTLFADTAPPSDFADRSKRTILNVIYYKNTHIDNVFLPSGTGVWLTSAGRGPGVAFYMTFDIL